MESSNPWESEPHYEFPEEDDMLPPGIFILLKRKKTTGCAGM